LNHNWKNDFYHKEYIIASFFERWLFNKADEIISVSNEVKNEIVSEYKNSPSKINTIYNGAPAKISKTVPNRANIDRNTLNLLTVGRLVPRKGVGDLIRSVYNLRKKGINLSLDIIGEGYIKKDLMQLAKQFKLEGKIQFHGKLFPNQVSEFLNKATIAIVPSIYEPCSLFGLEALSHGCPLISSDVGGLNEILTDNHNVVFYRRGEVEELTTKIQYLIENTKLRQKLSECGIKTIQEQFNWNETAKNTVKVFEKILANR
jgi:glycosyltransferase involved in cell wall biosynthesis